VLIAAIVVTILILLLSWGRMAWWSLKIAVWYPLPQPAADAALRKWPKAVVLLPLRGSDPMLLDCLRGLCRQDYPNFEIGLILDSQDDEAWGPVREAISEFPRVRIHPQVLTERLETCSLKSSALLQAVRSLPPDVEVVAVIDADVMAKPWWLRELVRPLLDDVQLGAVCGLRWFLPHQKNCGSVIRQVWNAAASAQMYALSIPWGGSMAYRADLLREPGFQQRWAETFVEDVSITQELGCRGRKLRMVPQLSMVNTETISVVGCFRFMRRQIFSVRMYNPAWWPVMLTCFGMVLSCVLAAIVSPAAMRGGLPLVARGIPSLLGLLIAVTTVPLLYTEYCLRPPKSCIRYAIETAFIHVPLIIATILLYAAAVFSACTIREIDWRGIRYEIGRGGSIRRLNDAPYRSRTPGATESLL
jgi:glycosyltransferase involved in cell wall biosynthesis